MSWLSLALAISALLSSISTYLLTLRERGRINAGKVFVHFAPAEMSDDSVAHTFLVVQNQSGETIKDLAIQIRGDLRADFESVAPGFASLDLGSDVDPQRLSDVFDGTLEFTDGKGRRWRSGYNGPRRVDVSNSYQRLPASWIALTGTLISALFAATISFFVSF